MKILNDLIQNSFIFKLYKERITLENIRFAKKKANAEIIGKGFETLKNCLTFCKMNDRYELAVSKNMYYLQEK